MPVADYDFNTHYVVGKNNDSVLETIQNQVLTYQNFKDPTQKIPRLISSNYCLSQPISRSGNRLQ
jgi:hypothetical protein